MYNEYKEMIKNGTPVYSFSKLTSYHNCPYEYKLTHIDRLPKKDNIYTKLGSLIHSGLEKVYKNEITVEEMREQYINGYMEIKSLGYKFPSEIIEENWNLCMSNFVDNFKKDNLKCEHERHFIAMIEDTLIQGYIDRITFNEDGSIDICDYKTSTKFPSSKFDEKGFQLLIYALGMEAQGYKVNKLYWNMLKYVSVKTKWDRNKSGVLVERNKLWEKIQSKIIKAYVQIGLDENEAYSKWIELMKVNRNDIPEEIKEFISIEDGIVEYPYNQKSIDKLKKYIKETVELISMAKDFSPIEINKDTSFYCTHLCPHNFRCEDYKKYIDNLPETIMNNNLRQEIGVDASSLKEFFS